MKCIKDVALSARPIEPDNASGMFKFAMPCLTCIGLLCGYENPKEDIQVIAVDFKGALVRMTRLSKIYKFRGEEMVHVSQTSGVDRRDEEYQPAPGQDRKKLKK